MTWSTSSTSGMPRCSAGWERIPAVRLNIWWKDWIQRRSATWCWNDMFSLFRSEHIFLVFSITQVLHKIPMKQYTQSHLFISVICIFMREMETFWIKLINWWCAAYTTLSSFWTLMCIISKLNIVLCYLRQATALIHLYTVGLVRPVASISCYVRFLGPLQLLPASCEASADDSFLSCRITQIRLIQHKLSKTERCFYFICFFCGWNMRQTATTHLSSDVWSSWNQKYSVCCGQRKSSRPQIFRKRRTCSWILNSFRVTGEPMD